MQNDGKVYEESVLRSEGPGKLKKTFGINVEHAVSKRSKVQTVCQTKRREYQVKTSFSSTKYDFPPVRVCFVIHNDILA